MGERGPRLVPPRFQHVGVGQGEALGGGWRGSRRSRRRKPGKRCSTHIKRGMRVKTEEGSS